MNLTFMTVATVIMIMAGGATISLAACSWKNFKPLVRVILVMFVVSMAAIGSIMIGSLINLGIDYSKLHSLTTSSLNQMDDPPKSAGRSPQTLVEGDN